MQQVVADGLVLNVGVFDMSDSIQVYAPINPHWAKPLSIPCSGSYTNNMTIINQNFAKLQATNVQLATQLTASNLQLSQACTQLTATRTQLTQTQTQLTQTQTQLTQTQTQLTSLDAKITQLQQQNATLLTEMKEQKTLLGTLNTSVAELTRKIAAIITYIPQFVRESSGNFIRMLTGIRTNTIADVEIAEIRAIEL